MQGSPSQDLLVPPQHRVLVRSKIAQKMFGTNEILVAAKQLLAIEEIEPVHVDMVDYVHSCVAHIRSSARTAR